MPAPEDAIIVNPKKKRFKLADFRIEASVALLTMGLTLGVLIVANPIGISVLAAVAAAATVALVVSIFTFTLKSLFTFLKAKKPPTHETTNNQPPEETASIQDGALNSSYQQSRLPLNANSVSSRDPNVSDQFESNAPSPSNPKPILPTTSVPSASSQNFFGAPPQAHNSTRPRPIDTKLLQLMKQFNPGDLTTFHQECQKIYQSETDPLSVFFPQLMAAINQEPDSGMLYYSLIALLELDATLINKDPLSEYYKNVSARYFSNSDQNNAAIFLKFIEYKISSLKEIILDKARAASPRLSEVTFSALRRLIRDGGNVPFEDLWNKKLPVPENIKKLLEEYKFLKVDAVTVLGLSGEKHKQIHTEARELNAWADKEQFKKDLRDGTITRVGAATLREMFPGKEEYQKMYEQCVRIGIDVLSDDDAAKLYKPRQ